MTDKINKLKVLQDEVNKCTKCDLHINNINYVFAKGNPEAKLLINAESPGQAEQEQGIPLVGRAGQCLDRAIKSLGINPLEEVYYLNIIICRPPNNRPPTSDEVSKCLPYCQQQINIVQPKVILALGNTALRNLLGRQDLNISSAKDSEYTYNGIKVLGAYHPSFILRTGGVNSSHFNGWLNSIKYAYDLSQNL